MDHTDSLDVLNIINEELQENIDETESSTTTVTNTDVSTDKKAQVPQKKFVRIPLGRVKCIMKLDPECNKISPDAVYLVTKATELFLEFLGRESAKYTKQGKRKTVLKRDLDAAISGVHQLCFLEGALE